MSAKAPELGVEEEVVRRPENGHTFVIAEIGQNHNGSKDLAKALADLVSRSARSDLHDLSLQPVDAIKLTKRDLSQELTDSAKSSPYDSPHAFGRTYGEHRAALELSDHDHYEIYQHAKNLGLSFVETICNPGALTLLELFTPDYIKIASRDLTNIPLLEAVADTGIPIILSTGMHGEPEIDEAVTVLESQGSEVAILHCVSEYPTHPDNVNLATIPYLKRRFPNRIVGYSDHTVGIVMPVAAVAIGAQIIEKHVTLDRQMKGTDQAGSLGPEGVRRMMRDIRMVERSIGSEGVFVVPSSDSAKIKLERSVASKRGIRKGELIREDDVWLLSPGTGFKWSERTEVIGKTARVNIPPNEVITEDMVCVR